MKYKEIGAEMKKGKISSIIGLLFASSFLIRTVVIHQMRASKKQESERLLQFRNLSNPKNRLRQKSKRILLRISLEMDQELLNQDLATTKPYLLIINTILVFETEPIIY